MVSRGYVPSATPVPAPDMSFVRLFNDNSVGWQHRGQYAIWTGASTESGPRYRLLERVGKRVAPIEHPDGSAVFHKIAAGVAFTVESMMGYWIAFDSDAMWVDTPAPGGRYAVLMVGGAAGKPGRAVVDWTCPSCGTAINSQTIDIAPNAFNSLLSRANALVAEFNGDQQIRACPSCHAIHPATYGYTKANETPPATAR